MYKEDTKPVWNGTEGQSAGLGSSPGPGPWYTPFCYTSCRASAAYLVALEALES